MKSKIVVGAMLYLATVGPGLGAGKRDIFGLTTGMPMERVTQLISDRGWSCKEPQNAAPVISIECKTKESQQLKIRFARALPGVPAMGIDVSFVAGGKQSVLASLIEQYGPNPREPYPWDLGIDDELQLASDGGERNFTVELYNDKMRIANERAAEARDAAKQPPTPKF